VGSIEVEFVDIWGGARVLGAEGMAILNAGVLLPAAGCRCDGGLVEGSGDRDVFAVSFDGGPCREGSWDGVGIGAGVLFFNRESLHDNLEFFKLCFRMVHGVASMRLLQDVFTVVVCRTLYERIE